MTGQEDFVLVPRGFLIEVVQAMNGEGPAHKFGAGNDADALDYIGMEAENLLSAAPAPPQPQGADDFRSAVENFMGYAQLAFLWSAHPPLSGEVEEFRKRYWIVKNMLHEKRQTDLYATPHPQPSGDGLSDEWRRAVEACARVAEAHDHEAGIKKLGKANWKYTSYEARQSITDESRGEKIASEIIAKAIRALSPTKSDAPPHTKDGE